MKEKQNKRYMLFTIALVLGVLLALLVASQSLLTVEVEADNVVKITKIVNYHDETGQNVPGAKMHIIVFNDELGK